MLQEKFIRKAYPASLVFVLALAMIGLILELLPKIEAEIVVVPTLILIIVLSSFELFNRNKRKVATNEGEK